MKKVILPVVLALFTWFYSANAQETIIHNFDDIAADTNFVWTSNVEGGNSYLTWKQDSTDKVEGAASLDIKTAIDSLHPWGSYSQIIYRMPTGEFMDWSSSDTLRLMIKVVKAPVYPQYMSFRIQLLDQGSSGSDQPETYLYQNDVVLNAVSDWYELKVPLHEINSQGRTVTPADTGFVEAPGSWGGFTYNDDHLNIDKLTGWNIVFVTTTTSADPNPPAGLANVPADSLEVKIDKFERTGNKPVPFVVFNGLSIPNQMGVPWTWGGGSVSVVDGAGPVPNSNAIKWIQGDDYGNGWNGFGFTLSTPFNLSGGWPVDSLKFMMKTEVPGDSLRAQFENGVGKVGYIFNAASDTNWHQYSFALKDFQPMDNTTGFDPANVSVFGIMSQHDSASPSRILGKAVLFSNIWTGNPKAPLPPLAPQGITAIGNNDNTNTIIWTDVPGQSGETYNIYYSKDPITDVTAAGVETAGTGVAHGAQTFVHKLIAPATDQSVTYYYAVVCKSGDGLIGTAGATTSSVTNTAKGVTVINPQAPPNFVADGDLSEWANITPFRLYVSDNSGTPVPNSKISSDTVSSGDIYVAVDQDYLYVAGHINTNNIVFDATQSTWLNTSADVFLGLYNWHGAPHSALQSGDQPDYHFRFAKDRVIIDGKGADSLVIPGSDYYWDSRFPDPLAGYNFEAKISWQDIAKKRDGGNTGTDAVFSPEVGMRIPFDVELNSCSPGATSRDGQLDYSSAAQGNSYQNVAVWSYTWVGDQWVTSVKNKSLTVNNYELAQNYPNPFNPTTSIRYTLMKPGLVSLTVYDILGRKVSTLVNRYETAGTHTVNFDASKLASGVYLYRISTGNFQSVKKMMLLK